MFAAIDIAWFVAGFALCWHFKDFFVNAGRKISAWWHSAADYAVVLENNAKALQAKADAIKAAVKS